MSWSWAEAASTEASRGQSSSKLPARMAEAERGVVCEPQSGQALRMGLDDGRAQVELAGDGTHHLGGDPGLEAGAGLLLGRRRPLEMLTERLDQVLEGGPTEG